MTKCVSRMCIDIKQSQRGFAKLKKSPNIIDHFTQCCKFKIIIHNGRVLSGHFHFARFGRRSRRTGGPEGWGQGVGGKLAWYINI